jgi:hypothetical protein
MKRGGQVIYAGPLGRHSYKLVEYFEVSIEKFDVFTSIPSLKSLLEILITSFILHKLQAISGVQKNKEGYNPATWMLEVSSATIEAQLEVDFAEIYNNSTLYQ